MTKNVTKQEVKPRKLLPKILSSANTRNFILEFCTLRLAGHQLANRFTEHLIKDSSRQNIPTFWTTLLLAMSVSELIKQAIRERTRREKQEMGLIFALNTLSSRELNIEFNLNIELHVALLV